MSIVAEFALPLRAIPDGETLEILPGATIELERLVPTGDAALPFFWVDEPRQVTQSELGEQFGISGRAVSNRLRRGTRNLVTSSLLDPTTRGDSNGPS